MKKLWSRLPKSLEKQLLQWSRFVALTLTSVPSLPFPNATLQTLHRKHFKWNAKPSFSMNIAEPCPNVWAQFEHFCAKVITGCAAGIVLFATALLGKINCCWFLNEFRSVFEMVLCAGCGGFPWVRGLALIWRWEGAGISLLGCFWESMRRFGTERRSRWWSGDVFGIIKRGWFMFIRGHGWINRGSGWVGIGKCKSGSSIKKSGSFGSLRFEDGEEDDEDVDFVGAVLLFDPAIKINSRSSLNCSASWRNFSFSCSIRSLKILKKILFLIFLKI